MPPRLGSHIRQLRQDAGVTQQQAADLAGLSLAAVRDLEQGRVTVPRSATLRRLAEGLRLSTAETEELIRRGQPGQLPAHDVWLQVLGPLSVQLNGGQVPMGSVRRRLLLGALALAANTPVSQERLVEMIWRHRPPTNAEALLRTDASRLRRRLRHPGTANGVPELAASAGSYQLTVSENQLDLLLFRRLADQARRARRAGDPVRACRLLAEAMSLWRGDPLADLTGLQADPAVVGLLREWQSAVVYYARTAAELGCHEEVLHLLRRVVEADPLHEAASAQLLMALAATGQAATAREMFETLRRRLAEEFGTDPGPELVRAHQTAQRPSVALASMVVARRQLPRDLAEFTGRAAELRWLHDRVPTADATDPAVTVLCLTGIGGVGKTQLAVHFAHQLLAAGRYPEVHLHLDLGGGQAGPAAALAALLGLLNADPDGMPGVGAGPSSIAAHDLPPDVAGRAAIYRDRLAGRAVLVLLDGASDAEQVRSLLPASPGSLVLVTSRRPLALDGAQLLPLDGLTTDAATRLLSQVAGPARIAADPEGTAALAALCGHLPLALSLAARRLRARSTWRPADLVARLLRAPDRLRELAAGTNQLRAGFDAAYQALSTAERDLFRVFASGPDPEVTVEAAAARTGRPVPVARWVLDRITDQHLASAVAGERYRFPELVRCYARTLPVPGGSGTI